MGAALIVRPQELRGLLEGELHGVTSVQYVAVLAALDLGVPLVQALYDRAVEAASWPAARDAWSERVSARARAWLPECREIARRTRASYLNRLGSLTECAEAFRLFRWMMRESPRPSALLALVGLDQTQFEQLTLRFEAPAPWDTRAPSDFPSAHLAATWIDPNEGRDAVAESDTMLVVPNTRPHDERRLTLPQYAMLVSGLELLPHRAAEVHAKCGFEHPSDVAREVEAWQRWLERRPGQHDELEQLRSQMRRFWERWSRASRSPLPPTDAPGDEVEQGVTLFDYAALCVAHRLSHARAEQAFAAQGLADPAMRHRVDEAWKARLRAHPDEHARFVRYGERLERLWQQRAGRKR